MVQLDDWKLNSLGILRDSQIIDRCLQQGMITPFDPALVNPASIDVRLGDRLWLEPEEELNEDYSIAVAANRGLINPRMECDKEGNLWVVGDISKATKEKPFLFQAKEFLLAHTVEIFSIPDDVSAEFKLKSSRARGGYDNALAVWCDPGWHGSVLTLELVNNFRKRSLPLYPGLLIGQMIFHSMAAPPDRNYRTTGRYNGDRTVMGSKG